MCGRFALRLNRHEVQQLDGYDVDVDEWEDEDNFVPRYNIAPRTNAPVIRHQNASGPSGSAQEGDHLMMQTMKWGLVPHWSKSENLSLNTTNARCENLVEGGAMWDSIKGKKRCAIPCQGYYEWLTKGKEKFPHFTKRKDGKLLLMAGLYDSAVIDGKTLWTFSIVTTDANKEFSWLHDRQPVFLNNHNDLMKWLDTSSGSWNQELTKMVRPYHDKNVPLECYAVPKEVGRVGTESSAFIEPITQRKDGIQAMFSKQIKQAEARDASPTKRELVFVKDDEERSPSPSPSRPSSKAAGKRKREETPDVVEVMKEETFSPNKSTRRVKEESPSPSKKLRMKEEMGDDWNQPDSANAQIKAESSPSKPTSKGRLPSPTKRKAKPPPPGNAKISSFFTKK